MDDDRLTARLRGLEAPIQPRERFVADLHDELAGRLGFVAVGGSNTAGRRVVGGRTGRGTTMRRLALLAAAALLLAVRLGVRADVTVSGVMEMLAAPGDGWQVAMPGIGIDPSAAPDLLTTQPYYRWPLYVVAA